MPAINEVTLTGSIDKIYPNLTTPSGIAVTRLILAHTSSQIEGGIERQVNCRIFCVWINQDLEDKWLGRQVKINGFLSINAQNKVVLHITNLDSLD